MSNPYEHVVKFQFLIIQKAFKKVFTVNQTHMWSHHCECDAAWLHASNKLDTTSREATAKIDLDQRERAGKGLLRRKNKKYKGD